MTKLESAEILIKQEGNCENPISLNCNECCCSDNSGYNNCKGAFTLDKCLAIAIAYKKNNSVNPISDKFCTFDE